jgi:hypothetical protein
LSSPITPTTEVSEDDEPPAAPMTESSMPEPSSPSSRDEAELRPPPPPPPPPSCSAWPKKGAASSSAKMFSRHAHWLAFSDLTLVQSWPRYCSCGAGAGRARHLRGAARSATARVQARAREREGKRENERKREAGRESQGEDTNAPHLAREHRPELLHRLGHAGAEGALEHGRRGRVRGVAQVVLDGEVAEGAQRALGVGAAL